MLSAVRQGPWLLPRAVVAPSNAARALARWHAAAPRRRSVECTSVDTGGAAFAEVLAVAEADAGGPLLVRNRLSAHAHGHGHSHEPLTPLTVRTTAPALESTSGTASAGDGGDDSGAHVRRGVLKWYCCGPTVYDDAHVGHARTYVCLDILRRVLAGHFGVSVFLVMGVTDVDDKIVQRTAELQSQTESSGGDGSGFSGAIAALQSGRGDGAGAGGDSQSSPAFLRLARHYERRFFADMRALGVLPPSALTRVSEHMSDIHAYIETLVESGNAYAVPGEGVYFETASLGGGYGKLRPSEHHGETAAPPADGVDGDAVDGDDHGDGDGDGDGAGPRVLHKRDRSDFALWKCQPEGAPGWASPWGWGRPGWHIECSAMSHAVAGPLLDLHTGGVDLAFPHHCNEIAQSEAHNAALLGSLAGGGGDDDTLAVPLDEWSTVFLHTGHVHIAGRKMSKSLKNFITVRELLAGDTDAGTSGGGGSAAANTSAMFRLFCLAHHYASNVTYSEDRMADAVHVLLRFQRLFDRVASVTTSGGDDGHGGDRAGGAERVPGWSASNAHWGPKEHAMYDAIAETRHAVDAALRHDFDTPTCLAALLGLTASVNTYLDAAEAEAGGLRAGVNVEVVSEAAATVGGVLQLFGVNAGGGVEGALGHAGGGGGGGGGDDAAVAALVAFRGTVRNTVVAHMRDAKKASDRHSDAGGSGSASALAADLLRECDIVRDEVLPGLGCAVADARSGASVKQRAASVAHPANAPQSPAAAAIDEPARGHAASAGKGAHKPALKEVPESAGVAGAYRALAELDEAAGLPPRYTWFEAESGMPTHDEHGEPVSARERKRLAKKLRAWAKARGLEEA